jgi:hypothetical protein
MPVTFHELASSRVLETGPSGTRELKYVAMGSSDDVEVRSQAESQLPASYDGVGNRRIRVEPVDSNHGLWEVVASYRKIEAQPPPQPGDSSYSFDTTGGTQHITQSRETVGGYAAAGVPAIPDFDEAIGVTDDGVEGVDVTVPVFSYTETHFVPAAAVTSGYVNTLFNLTGRVNSSAFKGFAAGEMLFLGASGSKRAGEDFWEITYRFACSPNATGLTVGTITGIAKKGWEYLWVLYEDVEDESAKRLVKRPLAAYVERVYLDGNFGALGI